MALIIIFYSTEGAVAKNRAREYLIAKHHARVYDVAAWDMTPDKCDGVEIMPDVPQWQKDRIQSVFGDLVFQEDGQEIKPQPEEPSPLETTLEALNGGDQQTGDGVDENGNPAQADKVETNSEDAPGKKAVHRGKGQWYVCLGEETISGPHTKAEATALAKE